MQRIALCLGLLVVACDAPSEPVDASVDASAAVDASRVCESNADCEDSLFCTEHRCDPGSAGADGRGCVEAPGPCGDLACDESDDSCAPTCDTPDQDGDGFDAMHCGGSDCDDQDANRFPGNPEVCDLAGHDEDCLDDTFGPTDLDGDGVVSSVCCNGDACGRDCDDASPLVPAVNEACNGADDDCDGQTDEGFDCAIGETMDCEACSAPALRHCLDDCSGFGSCGRETETCNYCDDTGDGLVADERGLASDPRFEISCTSPGLVALGEGFCDSDSRLITWLFPTEEVTGAFARPFELGHDLATVGVTLQYHRLGTRPPGAQWSLTIMREGSSLPEPSLTRGGGPSGSPEGYSAVWDMREVSHQLEIFAPIGTSRGTRDELPDVVVSTPTPVLLPLRWEIQPDDPDTPVDDFSIELYSEAALGAVYACAGSDCPVRFEPGDRLVAYMGGSIEDYSDTNPRADGWQILDLWNEDSPGRAVIDTERVCGN